MGSVAPALAVQEWNILVLRVDFPLEEPDESTTTGMGKFDLRSFEEALPDYSFPYDTPPHDRLYFENHLKALARYYQVVSRGEIEISSAVFPRDLNEVYTLPGSALSYGNGRTAEEIGEKWVQLFRAAVELADADPNGPFFRDFNSFLIIHAGVGNETGQFNDIRSVYLAPEDMAAFLQEPLLADDGQFEIGDGWILPEAVSLWGQGGLNGLMAKFFGHQLGLPGLSNFVDGLPAVGGWSLMDIGANNLGFVLADSSLQPVVGFVPAHPMAWSKARLGWIEPLEIRRDTTVALIATDRDGDLPRAVRIPITEQEYFLLENRQQRGTRGVPPGISSPVLDSAMVWIDSGQVEFSREGGAGVWLGVEEYDAFIPGSGILIWHVDEEVIQQRLAAGGINNDPVRPGIVLEEADGFRDIGNPSFERLREIEGSSRDPFYKGFQTSFGKDTQPDSRSNAELESGIHIEVRSEPGDTMMVEVRFARILSGWPQPVEGAGQLHGADADGDGDVELLVEYARGVQVVQVEAGLASWRVERARFLASADADGDGAAEIFVARGNEVSAWKMGAEDPLWTTSLNAEALSGLFSADLGLFPGRPVLALLSSGLVLLDARTGEIVRREAQQIARLAVADVDGDAGLELVLAVAGGVQKLGSNGLETLWEGQVERSGWLSSGDLDGDGRTEMVVAEPAGAIQVLKAQESGFRRELADLIQAEPVLGDVDGDGFLEVVVAGTDQVHVLRNNGSTQADFPALLARYQGVGRMDVAPVLLDLDADGRQEIFPGTRKGVYGMGEDGVLLPGFPLLTAGPLRFSPLGADVDGDGMLELAALAGEALYVWEPQNFSPAYEGRLAGWGQAGFSAAGTYAHSGPRAQPEPPPGASPLLPAERVYCYPNPVGSEGQVYLRFFLSEPARIKLEVFDAIGERVDRLEREEGLITPAENEIDWSTSGYASGLYICRLEARTGDGLQSTAFVKMAVSR